MVKPRRKIASTDDLPEFFKIFIPDQCSHRLRLPPDFLKYLELDGEMPDRFVLKSRKNRSFCVNVNKIGYHCFLGEGWQEFVEDHSLEFGDFLVFSYSGNSKFYVTIFGKNSCIKPTGITRISHIEPPMLQENESIPAVGSENLMDFPENHKAVNGTCNSITEYPWFKVVMRPAYVEKWYCSVPSAFAMQYEGKVKFSQNGKHMATLQLFEKSWPVVLLFNKGLLRLGSGWRKFALENALKVGDSCTFELIEKNSFVLRVSVSRCSAITTRQSHVEPPTHQENESIQAGDSENLMDFPENDKAANAACDPITEYPWFKVVMRPAYIKNWHCCVPSVFKMRCDGKVEFSRNGKHMAVLQLLDKSWPVVLLVKKGVLQLSSGWRNFAQENSLKVGDACTFELIEENIFVLRVSISRCSGE